MGGCLDHIHRKTPLLHLFGIEKFSLSDCRQSLISRAKADSKFMSVFPTLAMGSTAAT